MTVIFVSRRRGVVDWAGGRQFCMLAKREIAFGLGRTQRLSARKTGDIDMMQQQMQGTPPCTPSIT